MTLLERATYHEAGHAVAAAYRFEGSGELSMVPDGSGNGGYCRHRGDRESWWVEAVSDLDSRADRLDGRLTDAEIELGF